MNFRNKEIQTGLKTSRLDGRLVIHTKEPYEITIDGRGNNRKIIIAKEAKHSAEGLLLDLEQCFVAAANSASRGVSEDDRLNAAAVNAAKEERPFWDIDCPSEKEINEQAFGLESVMKSTMVIKMSTFMQMFKSLIMKTHVLETDTGKTIGGVVWERISLNDKQNIAFKYCAFFANPFQRLAESSPDEDEKQQNEVVDD